MKIKKIVFIFNFCFFFINSEINRLKNIYNRFLCKFNKEIYFLSKINKRKFSFENKNLYESKKEHIKNIIDNFNDILLNFRSRNFNKKIKLSGLFKKIENFYKSNEDLEKFSKKIENEMSEMDTYDDGGENFIKYFLIKESFLLSEEIKLNQEKIKFLERKLNSLNKRFYKLKYKGC